MHLPAAPCILCHELYLTILYFVLLDVHHACFFTESSIIDSRRCISFCSKLSLSLPFLFCPYFMVLEHLQCPVCRAWIYCQTSSTLTRANYEGRPIVRVFDVERYSRQDGAVVRQEDSISAQDGIAIHAADTEQVAARIDARPSESVFAEGHPAALVSNPLETELNETAVQRVACSRKRQRIWHPCGWRKEHRGLILFFALPENAPVHV
jgi:hypothetical protein